MRCTPKLFCASLLTAGALLAQGPPPGDFGGRGGFGPGFGGAPVTGAPYSATRTETRQETLTDGNQIQETHTAKVYRDAEGRTRMETTMTPPSGTAKTMITIFDPVAGFMARLDPATSTAMKETLPTPPSGTHTRPARPEGDANGPQIVKTDLGANTIAGLAATGTKTTVTIPAGAMGNAQPIVETREVWISTALKVPVQASSSDPRRGNSNMLLSNISQAAPEASLFTIPSGYTVKDAPAHGGPGGHMGGPPPMDGGSR